MSTTYGRARDRAMHVRASRMACSSPLPMLGVADLAGALALVQAERAEQPRVLHEQHPDRPLTVVVVAMPGPRRRVDEAAGVPSARRGADLRVPLALDHEVDRLVAVALQVA